MATFFGMTKLGSPNRLAACSRRQEVQPQQQKHQLKRKAIANLSVSSLLEAFEALALQNESRTVRRALVPQIFEDLLGRQLDQTETELLLRHFDVKTGHMKLSEFQTRVQDFVADEHPVIRCGERPMTGGEEHAAFGRYSYLQLCDMRMKGTRNGFGPMDVLKYPLTGNQSYGWHTQPPLPKTPKNHFPLKSTEVTRNEGISLASYYLV